MEHEIADGIYPKEVYQLVGIKHISLRFAHLSVSLEQPGMSKYLLRQRKSQSHQENRPVNSMETDDIFSNQMQVCRPVFFKLLCTVSITVIADSGDVVGQRIQPYINHMPGIKVYRNSPFKGGSGHTQILESRQKEVVHHLIFPGYRLDKLRMLIDILDQLGRIFAHSEEISLFLSRSYRTSAVRTLSVHQLRFCKERFTGSTVQTFIISFVNISLVIKLFKYFLYLLLMIVICSPDKLVIGSSH